MNEFEEKVVYKRSGVVKKYEKNLYFKTLFQVFSFLHQKITMSKLLLLLLFWCGKRKSSDR